MKKEKSSAGGCVDAESKDLDKARERANIIQRKKNEEGEGIGQARKQDCRHVPKNGQALL